METPEKDNFLETIRELRKEADEKLTGNRHYLAIQKLDEIAEAVQQRDMSSEELGAVSNVLRGDAGEAADWVEEEPVSADESVDLTAPAVGVAAAAVAVDAAANDEPVVEEVLEQKTAESGEEQDLPNWWKDKEGGDAPTEPDISQSDAEPEIEMVTESVEESSLDLTSVAAGVAVSGVAAAGIADQLSSETVEIGEIAEEIELIEVPEVEIDTPDVELPAINIEAIEPEVEIGEVMPEVEPEVELPEIETIAEPEIVPEIEIAEVVETPEVAALPEIAVEPAGLVVEQVALDEVVMPNIEMAEIPVENDSAQIADLLFDVDGETQAAVAAGAAAVAIGVAGVALQDEPAQAVAPEKLSFPSVPETSEYVEIAPEVASAVPAAKILNGDNIGQHPTYGGNRGGILKRFANSLRGKDYI